MFIDGKPLEALLREELDAEELEAASITLEAVEGETLRELEDWLVSRDFIRLHSRVPHAS